MMNFVADRSDERPNYLEVLDEIRTDRARCEAELQRYGVHLDEATDDRFAAVLTLERERRSTPRELALLHVELAIEHGVIAHVDPTVVDYLTLRNAGRARDAERFLARLQRRKLVCRSTRPRARTASRSRPRIASRPRARARRRRAARSFARSTAEPDGRSKALRFRGGAR